MDEIKIDYPELCRQFLGERQEKAQAHFKEWIVNAPLSEASKLEMCDIAVELFSVAEKQGFFRGFELGKKAIQF